ncbi:MAG: tetratricopeptide repeat protein [Chloroherpetonaceae bacterium]|nr:tetratricopeptide repeat protein [Chloroherpetonaceae bacterium]
MDERDFFDSDSEHLPLQDREEFVKRFQSLIDRDLLQTVHDPDELEEAANILIEEGDYHRALRVASYLVDIAPYNGDAWFRKGIALANLSDYAGAVEAFEESRSP